MNTESDLPNMPVSSSNVCHKIINSMLNTLDKKGADYSPDNFVVVAEIMTALTGKEFRPYEIAMILHCVKLHRYMYLTQKNKMPKNESILDTTLDSANYVVLAERERLKELENDE